MAFYVCNCIKVNMTLSECDFFICPRFEACTNYCFSQKERWRDTHKKNMFDLHSYHGNRQSIQVKMAPGYGRLQILQNIYYHILFNLIIYINMCVCIILNHHIQMIKRIESWFESIKHKWTCMKVVQLRHCAGFVISPSPGLAQPDTPVGSPSQDLLL